MTDCSRHEERLPLLRYGNELSAEERVEVLAHLEECSSCRSLRDQIEATAASLDAVPLERAAPERMLGLRDRVLTTVQEGVCRHEEAALGRDELTPEERAELDAHLETCPRCQEAARAFAQVGQALDLVPLVRPEGLDDLKQRVLEQVGAPRRAGRLLTFVRPLILAAAAAAVLLVAWLGGRGVLQQRTPLDTHQLSAIKQGADELLRGNRKDEAVRIYRLLLEQGAGNQSLEARRLLASAQRSLDAIARLEHARSAQDTEMVITYYPDSPVVPPALAQYVAQRSVEPQATPALQHTPREPTVSLDPVAIADLRLSRPEIRQVVDTSRAFQQVVLLQQGMRYENLGQLTQARKVYAEVIALNPETEAARVAREALTRLG